MRLRRGFFCVIAVAFSGCSKTVIAALGASAQFIAAMLMDFPVAVSLR